MQQSFKNVKEVLYLGSPLEDKKNYFFCLLNIVLVFVRQQIDSQIPDATFQTALYRVPPPKSLAAESGKSSQSFTQNGRIFAFRFIYVLKYLASVDLNACEFLKALQLLKATYINKRLCEESCGKKVLMFLQ